jgi:hypothetical protein
LGEDLATASPNQGNNKQQYGQPGHGILPNKAWLTIYWQAGLASIKTQTLAKANRACPALAKLPAIFSGKIQKIPVLLPARANYLTIMAPL